MAGNGSPRQRSAARRVLVGAARVAALLAIIIGISGVFAPELTRFPSFYLSAAAGAAILAMYDVAKQERRASRFTAVPPSAMTPLIAAPVDQSEIAAAREDEREKWASEVAQSVTAVHRLREQLQLAETARQELAHAMHVLRQQVDEAKSAASDQVTRADAIVADLNSELAAGRAREQQQKSQFEAESEHLRHAAAAALEEIERSRAAHDEARSLLHAEKKSAQSALDDLRAKLELEWGDKLKKIVDGMTVDNDRAIGDAVAQRNKAASQLHKLSERVKELEHAVEDRERVAVEAKKMIDEERAAREQAVSAVAELSQRSVALQRDLDQATEQVRTDREKAEVDWNAKLQHIVSGMAADHENALGDAIELREAARAEARNFEMRLHELQRAAEAERGARGRAEAHAQELAANIERLQSQIRDLEMSVNSERTAREQVESQARESADRASAERSTREQLESEWNAKLQKIVGGMAADHENDVGEAVEKREAARAEARTLAGRVQQLEEKLATERAARERVEAEAREVSGHFGEVERRLAEASAARDRTETEWNEKLQRIVSGMAADHENDIGQAVEQREAARAEGRSLEQRMQELQRTAANERAARENAETQARDLAVRITEAEQLLADAAAVRDRAETEWNEKLQKIVAGIASDHENDIGEAMMERETARAEARHLGIRVQELQKLVEAARAVIPIAVPAASVVTETALRAAIDTEWSAKLQTIVSHLASDHEADIGKALEEKEEAKAAMRTFELRAANLQQQIERDRLTYLAAQEKWSAMRDALQARVDTAEMEIAPRARDAMTALAQPAPAPRPEPEPAPPPPPEPERIPSLNEPLMAPFAAVSVPTPEPFMSPFAQQDEQRTRAEVLEIAEQARAVLTRTAPGTLPIPVPRDGKRPMVLFVHHDPNMRTMWRDHLHKTGYDVLTAVDGLEGLKIVSAHKPDVVVADAQMPKMDGRELCQLIKSNEATAATKVVLMSGLYTSEMSKEVAENEFQPDEVLRKPVKFDVLQSALAALLAPPQSE